MPGVVRTRVGYSGGTSKNPTYRNIGDHSEAIQIDYDPTVISYTDLLDIFWESHDPTVQSWSLQYKSAVFYHNEEQKRLSEGSKDMLESSLNGKAVTRMLPFTGFHLAEDYHQKYNLRNHMSILNEFEAKYPDVEGMVSSTATARVNGYLGGNGTCEQLKAEISGFGLSDTGKKELLEEVCQGIEGKTCHTNNCLSS